MSPQGARTVSPPRTKHQWLQELRRRLGAESEPHRRDNPSSLPRHRAFLQEFLPPQRVPEGMLVEWLSGHRGTGAATAAFLTARELQQQGQLLVVIDGKETFYPPAAQMLGLDLAEMIVVRPRSPADALWAWEQALRAAGTTVIGHLERSPPQVLRRLKLAVEEGGGLGLLLRPLLCRVEPSWADLRLAVSPLRSDPACFSLSRRVQVEALYVRGQLERRCVVVDISDETATLSVVPPLARAAVAHHSARAS